VKISLLSTLNIIRILEAISPEVEPVDDHDDMDSTEPAHIIISSNGRPQSALSATSVPKYDIYRRRLEPLIELEERLTQLLSSPDEDEATHLGPSPGGWASHSKANGNGKMATDSKGRPLPTVYIPERTPSHQSYPSLSSPVSPVTASTSSSQSLQLSGSPGGSNTTSSSGKSKNNEVAVHTTTNWKKAFALGMKSRNPKSAHTGEIAGWWEDPDDPVHVLNACAPAMLDLWRDPAVKKRLSQKRIRLQESSGL
jgi:guanine nucleotide-binding protein alpha-1 subunit